MISRPVAWGAAFVLGALAPAALFVGLTRAPMGVFVLALMVTAAHVIVLGIPASLLYRRRGWTKPEAAVAGGFIIGALPTAVLLWPYSGQTGHFPDIGGTPSILSGLSISTGWQNYLEAVATCGGLGALGAAVFWLTLKMTGVLR
jgi:hypothetical protein